MRDWRCLAMSGWPKERVTDSANGQPLNFWEFPCLIGKIKFKFLFHGPKWHE